MPNDNLYDEAYGPWSPKRHRRAYKTAARTALPYEPPEYEAVDLIQTALVLARLNVQAWFAGRKRDRLPGTEQPPDPETQMAKCPNVANHFEPDKPSGNPAHRFWVLRMQETHVQRECPGCRYWCIWEPKRVEPVRKREPKVITATPTKSIVIVRRIGRVKAFVTLSPDDFDYEPYWRDATKFKDRAEAEAVVEALYRRGETGLLIEEI